MMTTDPVAVWDDRADSEDSGYPVDEQRISATLGVLRDATAIRDAAGRVIERTVVSARIAGATWDEIADALGVSRQAAWERYRKVTDGADPAG